MTYTIEKMNDSHGPGIITIFNHYIQNTFSAYFEDPLPAAFFGRLVEIIKNHPAFVVKNAEDELIGFAFIRAYNSASSFKHTAELTYFNHPNHTRKGLGTFMLNKLIEESKARGVENVIASIASKNELSLNFHEKHGFKEQGRLLNVGKKFDQYFDVVYMQKQI